MAGQNCAIGYVYDIDVVESFVWMDVYVPG